MFRGEKDPRLPGGFFEKKNGLGGAAERTGVGRLPAGAKRAGGRSVQRKSFEVRARDPTS